MKLLPIWFAIAVGCGGHRASPDHPWIDKQDSTTAGRALTPDEQRVLDRNGFAILGAAEMPSFHIGYTSLFHAHQPVYVTADSLLYAWHVSYDTLVYALEVDHLIAEVGAMLDELREGLAQHRAGDPREAQARADVDVYLATAKSLLTGKVAAPVAGGDAKEIAALVERAVAHDGTELAWMGHSQQFDWSMFEPRGHYATFPEMQQYFRAISWLGRAELRIAEHGRDQPWVVDRRAFAAAKLLGGLFAPKVRARWDAIDRTLATLVGPSNAMSVPGLEAGIAGLASESDADLIAAFEKASQQPVQTQMLKRGAGTIAFVALGQRMVYDAKTLADVSYGNLAQYRMMPSPLDIGWAVLDNPSARRLLTPEITKWGGEYTHALEAARAGKTDQALWTGNLYHLWLTALRNLSPDPRRDAGLPAPLQSDAWGKRMLNTQLASWAELRHDNLLYAAQSFSAIAECAYPDAYIDPYPEFYAAMEAIAAKGKQMIETLPFKSEHDAKRIAFFTGMGDTMKKLHALADKERAKQPLTDDDLGWINHMVSINGKSAGCTVVREPEGWYADLYLDHYRILTHEPIIADVHTQPSDETGAMVGRVLHVGTRFPRMLVTTLDHDGGTHRATYRGFVSSYAEEITTNFNRYTDETWRDKLEKTPAAVPAWLSPLVPR